MKKILLSLLAGAALALLAGASTAQAQSPHRADKWAMRMARTQSWHRGYYNTAKGYAVPLVVPPTAHMQASWGWGVTHSETRPIYHQFHRSYPGYMGPGGEAIGMPLRGTPHWPSHTDQFGYYYIRGPWD